MRKQINRTLACLIWCFLGLLPSIESFAATCQKTGTTCIDTTPSKTVSGTTLTLAQIGGCWQYQDTYTCANSTNTTDTCAPLVQQGCGQVGSTCVDYLPDGVTCDMSQLTYQCQLTPASTSTTMDCGGQVYCMNGNCTNTGYPPDQDFAKAAVSMEIGREAGNYMDPNTLRLFSGESDNCTVTLSIFDCCQSNTHASGSDNHSVLMGMGLQTGVSFAAQGAKYLGSEAIQTYGVPYMYDALYAASPYLGQAISGGIGTAFDGITNATQGVGFSPSVGYMGLSIGYGAPATGSTILAGSSGSAYLAFNPVTFYIAVAIMVYEDLSKCSQEQQLLGQKRGQNLCTEVGTYCSEKVLGACVQDTQSYCCFNSVLAKIIENGAHQQLGIPWGSPQTPNCAGLTIAQIGQIDFSQIDFSQFIAQITPSVKTPNYAVGRATQQITVNKQQVTNYYQTP